MWRRLRRWLLWTLGGLVGLSVLSVLLLRYNPPVSSAFIVHAYETAWSKGDWGWRAQHHWTPYEAISPYVKIAVIASEDQKFPAHYGFDLDQIDHALEERESGRRVRGASTISQQVAKNLYLWPGQSFLRKGVEAYLTVLLETFGRSGESLKCTSTSPNSAQAFTAWVRPPRASSVTRPRASRQPKAHYWPPYYRAPPISKSIVQAPMYNDGYRRSSRRKQRSVASAI